MSAVVLVRYASLMLRTQVQYRTIQLQFVEFVAQNARRRHHFSSIYAVEDISWARRGPLHTLVLLVGSEHGELGDA